MEPQVVKMKFRRIGRPSFISSGSETTLPSSRTRLIAGTAYLRTDLVVTLAAGTCSDDSSSAACAEAASTRSMTTISAARRRRRGCDCGIMARVSFSGSRHNPVALGDQGRAAGVAEMHDVTALGCESLIGGERQARVVTGDDPMLEQALQLLDQVGPREIVRHAVQDVREQAAGQEGIRLDLLRHQGNAADRKPPEWVIEADAPLARKIERVGHDGVLA